MSASQKTLVATRLLNQVKEGDDKAVNQLYDLVYEELRILAKQQLKKSHSKNTLHTTALVHEAYLKMFDRSELDFQNRTHFFALSARVMRQIIIDAYRMKLAEKRGGAVVNATLDDKITGEEVHIDQLLTIDHALEKIFKMDERMGKVVECKFFAGMKEKEIAACLGVSVRTIRYDWQKARMWLARELLDEES